MALPEAARSHQPSEDPRLRGLMSASGIDLIPRIGLFTRSAWRHQLKVVPPEPSAGLVLDERQPALSGVL